MNSGEFMKLDSMRTGTARAAIRSREVPQERLVWLPSESLRRGPPGRLQPPDGQPTVLAQKGQAPDEPSIQGFKSRQQLFGQRGAARNDSDSRTCHGRKAVVRHLGVTKVAAHQFEVTGAQRMLIWRSHLGSQP